MGELEKLVIQIKYYTKRITANRIKIIIEEYKKQQYIKLTDVKNNNHKYSGEQLAAIVHDFDVRVDTADTILQEIDKLMEGSEEDDA